MASISSPETENDNIFLYALGLKRGSALPTEYLLRETVSGDYREKFALRGKPLFGGLFYEAAACSKNRAKVERSV
jgi:hypothetical protein